MKRLLIISLAFLVEGCANPINRYTAGRYYEMGMEEEYRGNLEAAREAYRRATLNADWGNLGPGAKAYTLYEYGRVSGYLCMHDEAEKYLKESLALQDKDQSVRAELCAPTLLELARFYYDINRKAEALPYYEEGIELVRKLDIEKTDPVRFATVLEEYAACLQVAGKMDAVQSIDQEAKNLRATHAGQSSEEPFQRYNTRCSK
jgi:tetratricopeptide (TPR) repeat protein